MKRSGIIRLGFTYAGCFLGAGYISGQEMWQYFGAFGVRGIAGLVLAMALLAAFGILLLGLIQRTGITEMDAIVVRFRLPWLRLAMGILEAVFLYGIVVSMSAGVGALFEQLLGVSPLISCLFFCILIAVVALTGARGMVGVFSVVTPVLVVFSILMGCAAWSRGGPVALPDVNTNPLLGSWWFSAITYISYNLLGSIGVITAAGQLLDKRRITVWWGVILACLLMLAMGLFILFGVLSVPGANGEQLPMLAVAASLHPALSYVSAALLLCGMFSTGLSCLVASAEYFKQQIGFFRRKPLVLALLLGAAAYVLSMVGYDNIIGSIFPFFGYLGIAALVLIIEHYIHTVRQQKKSPLPK